MQTVKEHNVDYDELTPNPLMTDMEVEPTAEPDAKITKRRYWTPKEEAYFYEIWGRENWKLTRHGKNTVFFAEWAIELRERFNIHVKAEEVQMKVNQTRAKFRQVKKQAALDKSGIARWKKFEIIDKILKNQFRPENAEPIPQEALQNNRDFKPGEVTPIVVLAAQPSAVTHPLPHPPSAANGSAAAALGDSAPPNEQDEGADEPNIVNATLTAFNSSGEQKPNSQYNYEPYSLLRGNATGYVTDDSDDLDDDEDPPMLHQLQTPKQLMQQKAMEQQQKFIQQQQQPETVASHQTSEHQAPNLYQLQHKQQQQQPHGAYAHTGTYAGSSYPDVTERPGVLFHTQNSTSNNNSIDNKHGVSGTDSATNAVSASPNKAQNNVHAMTSPRISAPRKRRSSSAAVVPVVVNNVQSSPGQGPTSDTLVTVYLEELRKKNMLMQEQKNIATKRLQVEERKVNLMAEFFPKCLDLQQQILRKLHGGSH